jgi:hypothetical protein
MDDKPFDTQRAPIVKKLFEQYATGRFTLAELATWAKEQGFTMPPSRRRKTIQEKLSEEDDDFEVDIQPIARIPGYTAIHKILTNPFYTGKIIGNNGQYVASNSHKALISEELFKKVQAELKRRKVSVRYVQRIVHPLRGKIRCDICHRVYTPYLKKGILYFGARCLPECMNSHKSFNSPFIAKKIGELIQHLTFTNEELIEINARANTDIALLELRRVNELESIERQKKKLREDLGYIRANKLNLLKTGVYTPEGLLEEENKLHSELQKLQASEYISDAAMHEATKEVIKLSELLKNLYVQYEFATIAEKEEIISLLFSELSFRGKELKSLAF